MASAASQYDPTCPQCGGSGWRPETVASKALPKVVPCECRAAALADYALRRAGIPRRFLDKDFNNYAVASADEAMMESLSLARGAARRFAKDYPALTKTGLLFYGRCGTGKTHLSIAIARELLAKGVDVFYCNVKDLLETLRHSYDPVTQTTPREVSGRVIHAEVLILDDLGAERLTDWVQETMYHLINERYQHGRGALVITTNHAFAEPARAKIPTALGRAKEREQAQRANLEETVGDRVGYRIFSRLQEMCRVVFIDAPDYRPLLRR